jgi:SAM-dependent methyltransferase
MNNNREVYHLLQSINRRPNPFEFYTAETLWNDEHISKQMLSYHLDDASVLASRPFELIDQCVDWMRNRFNIDRETGICDFGCGPGLYTSRLAQLKAAVTGVDLSRRSIEYAKKTAVEQNLAIDYHLQNYLTFETDKTFDLITMIYCDLCPLSPEQRKTMLQNFHRFLNNDGHLFLDVFSLKAFENREEVAMYENRQMKGFWSSEDYYGFMNTFKYDDEKLVLDKYTIIEENRFRTIYNWLQYFSPESLRKEFEENGFIIVEQYSDVLGTPYSADSPEFAVVAKKI